METAGQRLCQSSVPKRQGVRQLIDIFPGRADIFCKALYNTSGILAEMGEAILTEPAGFTVPIRIYGDAVAGFQIPYLFSGLYNDSGSLVSQRHRVYDGA